MVIYDLDVFCLRHIEEEDFNSKGSTHRWVQFYGLPQRRRSVPLRQNSSPVGALGRLRSFSDAGKVFRKEKKHLHSLPRFSALNMFVVTNFNFHL